MGKGVFGLLYCLSPFSFLFSENLDKIYDQEKYLYSLVNLTKLNIMTTIEAINIIVSSETLPPQIDYVSPSDKRKVVEAETYLKSISQLKREEAYDSITKQLESYFTPIDGCEHSPASLNAMF